MVITSDMKNDLKWWINNIMLTENPIREKRYTREIFSDSSKNRLGHCLSRRKTKRLVERERVRRVHQFDRAESCFFRVEMFL